MYSWTYLRWSNAAESSVAAGIPCCMRSLWVPFGIYSSILFTWWLRMSTVAELSMVMPLPSPPRRAHHFWVASQLFADVIWFFWFASFSTLNLLSQTNHPFDRLIAYGLILKHEVQLGKTWLMQVQRTHRTKFTTWVSGEEVSLVFSGETEREESLDLEIISQVVFALLFTSLTLCVATTVFLVEEGCLQLA